LTIFFGLSHFLNSHFYPAGSNIYNLRKTGGELKKTGSKEKKKNIVKLKRGNGNCQIGLGQLKDRDV